MPRKNRTCGTALCWHCQHPQWKRKCLGPGGTKDDSYKDYQERNHRRNKRAIIDANVSVQAECASTRPTTSMNALSPVAQFFGLAAAPTAVPAHAAGKKRNILQMLQGPPCCDESEPAKKKTLGGHSPSSTTLLVLIEPVHLPTNIAGQLEDIEGHYATLGLEPGSSLEEVRKSYRRRSLETHPDKGGDASQFRKVGEAFHVLSDRMKRADCNDGRDASAAPAHVSPGNVESAVHPVCLAMLTLPRNSWRGLLVGLKPEVLNAICTMLKERTDTVAEAPCANEDGEPTGDDNTRGVLGKAGYYSVKLGWRHFYVKNGRPIRTLEQAIDINVCLSRMRNTAMLRYEDRARDLRRAERGQDQSMMNATDDCCPPLLPCELHEMLLTLQDPLMHFVFAFDLNRKPRMMSPWTPRIDAAQHYHDLIRRVQARKYRPLAKTLDPKIEITNMMQEQAGREREARKALEHDMAAELAAELARRQCEPPPAPTEVHVPCDTLALGNSAQLALLDECREAMIATKHSTEALQEELRKRTAASDDITRLESEKSELENEVLRLQRLQNSRQAVAAAASHGRQSRISWRANPFQHLQAEQSEAVQNQAAKREIARMNGTRQTAPQAAFEMARHL